MFMVLFMSLIQSFWLDSCSLKDEWECKEFWGTSEMNYNRLRRLFGSEQKQFEPDEKAYLKYRLVKELSKFQENGNVGSSKTGEEEFFDLGAELDNSTPMDIKGCKEISTEKVYGFGAILQELKESAPPDKVYPNFHYHMGMACSEMGFRNEAIEQFQMAIKKGQNPFEAARLLDSILAEEGSWKGTSQSPDKFFRKDEVFKKRGL